MTRESMETRPKKWISQADTGHEGDQIKKPLCGTDPPVRGRGSELLLDPFLLVRQQMVAKRMDQFASSFL